MSRAKKFETDKNLNFIRYVDKWPREQKVMARSKVGGRILKIFDIFEELEADEIMEWFDTIFIKIIDISRRIREAKELKNR